MAERKGDIATDSRSDVQQTTVICKTVNIKQGNKANLFHHLK